MKTVFPEPYKALLTSAFLRIPVIVWLLVLSFLGSDVPVAVGWVIYVVGVIPIAFAIWRLWRMNRKQSLPLAIFIGNVVVYITLFVFMGLLQAGLI